MIHIDLMDTMDITDLLSLLRCCALLLEFNYCWFCSCYSIRVMFSYVVCVSLAYLIF